MPLSCRDATFHLAFRGYRILNSLEFLLKDECYRPPAGGVTIKNACLMLLNARCQPVARRPDVIRAIGTAKNVEIIAHGKSCTLPSEAAALAIASKAATTSTISSGLIG